MGNVTVTICDKREGEIKLAKDAASRFGVDEVKLEKY
jgi:hypothetical protein